MATKYYRDKFWDNALNRIVNDGRGERWTAKRGWIYDPGVMDAVYGTGRWSDYTEVSEAEAERMIKGWKAKPETQPETVAQTVFDDDDDDGLLIESMVAQEKRRGKAIDSLASLFRRISQ